MNKNFIIPTALRRRAQQLCDTMQEISGYDPAEDSRKRPVVTARIFVCYVLLLEGWSEHRIGITVGWDHSTINYYRKRMVEILTLPGFDAERELWEQFKKAI